MGRFLGSWDIDDVLRVHIQTSSVTTGAATDADAAPTWRVYEDDTATPVTTGSFSTLNSQTGFYVANITLAASIGYEVGRQYAIRTQATVGGVIGADVHSFQIQSEVRLAAGAITAGTITAGALQGFTLGSVAGTVGSVAAAVTVGSTAASAIASSVSVNATAVAAIADAVWAETAAGYTTAGSMGYQLSQAESLGALVNAIWDEPKANHTTADTYGEYLDATLSGIGAAGAVTVGSTSQAAIAAAVQALALTVGSTSQSAIAQAVQALALTLGSTSQAAIASQITAGSIGAVTVGSTSAAAIVAGIGAVTVNATTQAAIVDAIWDEAKADHTGAGTYGELLDSTVSAIRSQTDNLAFNSGAVNANIVQVNEISVTGNGQTGTEWGPGS